MEQERQPKPGKYIDIITDINSPIVRDLFAAADFLLYHSGGNAESVKAIEDDYIERIDYAIGMELIGHVATVSGIFYGENRPRQNITEFTHYPIIYDGVANYTTEDDTIHLFMKFHSETYINDDKYPTKTSFFTQLDKLVEFSIPNVETLLKELENAEITALNALTESGLFDLFINEQRKILDLILRIFDRDAGLMKGSILNIKADYYAGRHDDDRSLDNLTDIRSQIEIPVDDRIDFSGRYIGSIFPETLLHSSKKFKSMKDFSISQGRPCLIVRDAALLTTYIIPSDSISQIDIIKS